MENRPDTVSVLFVCMGNICRSPTAHGVFRQRVAAAGLSDRILVESAGTHAYHVGHPPDDRSQAAAVARGYDLGDLRARLVSRGDFSRFDYILAMDEDNLAELKRMAPEGSVVQPRLFTEYSETYAGREVPDPYTGGAQGFADVLDMIEDTSTGLLEAIKKELGGTPSSS
ncbi:MAG: low molecular weight protein-tyrosine-phosphatase [Betaproteobacteria bacterium]